MKAFITGITGQDGSYLSEYLLDKGWEVHGLIRRSSSFNTQRLDHIFNNPNLTLHYGDILDASCLYTLIREVQPDHVYHLAAQSHVGVSFKIPDYTVNTNVVGTVNLLEAVHHCKPEAKVYNAASSEMFGNEPAPQNEETRLSPVSPYAVSKVAAYHMAKQYRDSYGMFVTSGILFNHESPRRGETFVTRKVTRAVGRIAEGLQDSLILGNLHAQRDWGHAYDYVVAMTLMMNKEVPDDYVVATGETHSVEELLDVAFSYANMNWREHVSVSDKYKRPQEVDVLRGDSSKARRVLRWRPTVGFQDMIEEMVKRDWPPSGSIGYPPPKTV